MSTSKLRTQVKKLLKIKKTTTRWRRRRGMPRSVLHNTSSRHSAFTIASMFVSEGFLKNFIHSSTNHREGANLAQQPASTFLSKTLTHIWLSFSPAVWSTWLNIEMKKVDLMHQTYQNHKQAILYEKINILERGIESCGPRDGERL